MTESGKSTKAVDVAQSDVDWPALRARVDAAAALTRAAQRHDTELSTQILAERARQLARPLVLAHDAGADGALVARLGETLVAFSLEHVVEILRPRGLTALPGASPPATLVLGWRGRILTVLDLHGSRAGSDQAVTDASRVLVLGQRRGKLAVLVDDVDTIRAVALAEVHAAPPELFGGAAWIRGMTSDAVAVADVPSLLAQYEG